MLQIYHNLQNSVWNLRSKYGEDWTKNEGNRENRLRYIHSAIDMHVHEVAYTLVLEIIWPMMWTALDRHRKHHSCTQCTYKYSQDACT